MSDNRLPFTSRNAWHFAVAAAYPVTTTSIRVLCEARITDGAVIAEWDGATNTGWMRSIVVAQAVPATAGHAGYLGEATAKPPVDGANLQPYTDAIDSYRDSHAAAVKRAKAVSSPDHNHPANLAVNKWAEAVEAAGRAYRSEYTGSSKTAGKHLDSAKAAAGYAEGHDKKVADLSEAAGAGDIDWNTGKGDWEAAKREGARIFADYNKPGNTDAVLAVKTAAAAAQKKGSYLGAVILGLANDYFERQR